MTDIGGKAELVAGFADGFAAPPKGVGALVDIGGKAEELLLVTSFTVVTKGVGALADIGGNAEVLSVDVNVAFVDNSN